MSHFNQVANKWDNEQKVSMMQKLSFETKKSLYIQKQIDIMDFGTGTGLFGLEFIEYSKSLLGVDVSTGMLEVYNEKTKDLPQVTSINIDLEKENIDKSFDLIISSMAFHHLNDPGTMISKFKNLLNKNGQLAIVDLDKEDGTFHPNNEDMGVKHLGFSKEEIQIWAKESNMKLTYQVINTIDKNNKKYDQFLAIFKREN